MPSVRATTAKISPQSSLILGRLQRKLHIPKTTLIDQVLARYEDQILIDDINEGYARLKSDKKAWKKELKERQELEGTMADGFDDE